jgi:hypothetical protein
METVNQMLNRVKARNKAMTRGRPNFSAGTLSPPSVTWRCVLGVLASWRETVETGWKKSFTQSRQDAKNTSEGTGSHVLPV